MQVATQKVVPVELGRSRLGGILEAGQQNGDSMPQISQTRRCYMGRDGGDQSLDDPRFLRFFRLCYLRSQRSKLIKDFILHLLREYSLLQHTLGKFFQSCCQIRAFGRGPGLDMIERDINLPYVSGVDCPYDAVAYSDVVESHGTGVYHRLGYFVSRSDAIHSSDGLDLVHQKVVLFF